MTCRCQSRLATTVASALFLLGFVNCGGGGSTSPATPGGSSNPPITSTSGYTLLAWSELGMHCLDGKDYSVAAVLPPYNTIHAKLIKTSVDPPQIVSTGVTITYAAYADSNLSINSSSSTKTNFWTYVKVLFGVQPADDVGLTGSPVQSNNPQPMKWNAQTNWFEAVGVPTIPYDDSGARNAYPMAQLVAKDSSGTILATATVVMAVSDEMSCSTCHASNTSPAAQPIKGWANDPDPAKDVKFNILRRHDDKHSVAPYQVALAAKGYVYLATLEDTARSGTPILCATCHSSNALGTTGVAGVPALTSSMHSLHGPVVNPKTGLSLDAAATPFESCYLCHPGVQTKCQRGAMKGIACFDCHGNLTHVGDATRTGWLQEPNCQMCHYGSTRQSTTFVSPGIWRNQPDKTFATTADVPAQGFSLFRFSKGHGAVDCAGCHGEPHAEYPTTLASDNAYSVAKQGYAGKLTECSACHAKVPMTAAGGPHGLHTIGVDWVSNHGSFAQKGTGPCAYCHGWNFRGSFLSQVKTARTFKTENRTVTYPIDAVVGCYDCHNGPGGG